MVRLQTESNDFCLYLFSMFFVMRMLKYVKKIFSDKHTLTIQRFAEPFLMLQIVSDYWIF